MSTTGRVVTARSVTARGTGLDDSVTCLDDSWGAACISDDPLSPPPLSRRSC